jgi:hypothetical protein
MQLLIFSYSQTNEKGRPYLTKSFFSTRMRIVARNPVRRRTVTQEFIIENQ